MTDDVPMTSFSVLFARYKGDLNELVRGAARGGPALPAIEQARLENLPVPVCIGPHNVLIEVLVYL